MFFKPQSNCKSQQGFTLIEIIIALAIVALAILAIMNSIANSANVASEMEKRLIANWVASNTMAEIQFSSRFDRVSRGSKSKTVKMATHNWIARSTISETEVDGVYLVTVAVSSASDSNKKPLVELTSAIRE